MDERLLGGSSGLSHEIYPAEVEGYIGQFPLVRLEAEGEGAEARNRESLSHFIENLSGLYLNSAVAYAWGRSSDPKVLSRLNGVPKERYASLMGETPSLRFMPDFIRALKERGGRDILSPRTVEQKAIVGCGVTVTLAVELLRRSGVSAFAVPGFVGGEKPYLPKAKNKLGADYLYMGHWVVQYFDPLHKEWRYMDIERRAIDSYNERYPEPQSQIDPMNLRSAFVPASEVLSNLGNLPDDLEGSFFVGMPAGERGIAAIIRQFSNQYRSLTEKPPYYGFNFSNPSLDDLRRLIYFAGIRRNSPRGVSVEDLQELISRLSLTFTDTLS